MTHKSSAVMVVLVVGCVAAILIQVRRYDTRTAETAGITKARYVAFALRAPIVERPFPQAATFTESKTPSLSWRALIASDFEPGVALRMRRDLPLDDPANSEVFNLKHYYFCDERATAEFQTSVFAVLNGNSILEIGNDWRAQGKQIPETALCVVFLNGVYIDHWANPGDLCVGKIKDGVCFRELSQLQVNERSFAICVFWNLEAWKFDSNQGFALAAKFADLEFASSHSLNELEAVGKRVATKAE